MNLYNRLPDSVEKAFLELTGAGHGFPTSNNSVMTRKVIPWLKIFVDRDDRYSQFLCPLMDNTGIRTYLSTCPLLPGGSSPSPSTSPSPSPSTSPSTPPGSTFSLVGAASSKCLDVPGGSQNNGTGLVIYTCNNVSNQRWNQTSADELRIYNSKCLEAGGIGRQPSSDQFLYRQ